MAMSPEIASFVVLRSGVSLMTWIIQHAAFSISVNVAAAIASRAVSLGIVYSRLCPPAQPGSL